MNYKEIAGAKCILITRKENGEENEYWYWPLADRIRLLEEKNHKLEIGDLDIREGYFTCQAAVRWGEKVIATAYGSCRASNGNDAGLATRRAALLAIELSNVLQDVLFEIQKENNFPDPDTDEAVSTKAEKIL